MGRARYLSTQLTALLRVSAAGARAHGASRLAVASRARRARSTQGFGYQEALALGILDPRRGSGGGFLSDSVADRFQERLNPEAARPLTGEKLVFHRLCVAHGLPVPALHALAGHHGRWSGAGLRLDGDAWSRLVGSEMPASFVLKPTSAGHGAGVRIVHRDGAAFSDRAGLIAGDAGALARRLARDPEHEMHMLQERLRNNDEVHAICPSETLQTLRVTTYVDADGRVTTLFAGLRVALTAGDTDNFSSGRAGNGLVPVSPGDGRMGAVIVARPDGCGFTTTAGSPGGRPVDGRRLESWAAAERLAHAACHHFLPLTTLGWDVALTPDGPVLIEANAGWHPFPYEHLRATVRPLEAVPA